jgi:hypothetical protein
MRPGTALSAGVSRLVGVVELRAGPLGPAEPAVLGPRAERAECQVRGAARVRWQVCAVGGEKVKASAAVGGDIAGSARGIRSREDTRTAQAPPAARRGRSPWSTDRPARPPRPGAGTSLLPRARSCLSVLTEARTAEPGPLPAWAARAEVCPSRTFSRTAPDGSNAKPLQTLSGRCPARTGDLLLVRQAL